LEGIDGLDQRVNIMPNIFTIILKDGHVSQKLHIGFRLVDLFAFVRASQQRVVLRGEKPLEFLAQGAAAILNGLGVENIQLAAAGTQDRLTHEAHRMAEGQQFG
jgi:hypothetical protein